MSLEVVVMILALCLIPATLLVLLEEYWLVKFNVRPMLIIGSCCGLVLLILTNLSYLPGPTKLAGIGFYSNFILTPVLFGIMISSALALTFSLFRSIFIKRTKTLLKSSL